MDLSEDVRRPDPAKTSMQNNWSRGWMKSVTLLSAPLGVQDSRLSCETFGLPACQEPWWLCMLCGFWQPGSVQTCRPRSHAAPGAALLQPFGRMYAQQVLLLSLVCNVFPMSCSGTFWLKSASTYIYLFTYFQYINRLILRPLKLPVHYEFQRNTRILLSIFDCLHFE